MEDALVGNFDVATIKESKKGKFKENERRFEELLSVSQLCRIKHSPIIIQPITTIQVYQLAEIESKIGGIPFYMLKEEKWRLHTFFSYPKTAAKSAILLAADGFAYKGNGLDDEVLCYFCTKDYKHWDIKDDVHDVHSRISPACSMVTKIDCDNVTMQQQSEKEGCRKFQEIDPSCKVSRLQNSNCFYDVQSDAAISQCEVTTGGTINEGNTEKYKDSTDSKNQTRRSIPNRNEPPVRSPHTVTAHEVSSNDASSEVVTSSNTRTSSGPAFVERSQGVNPAASSTPSMNSSTLETEPETSRNQTPSGGETPQAAGSTTTGSTGSNQSGQPPASSGQPAASTNSSGGDQNTVSNRRQGSTVTNPTYKQLGIITERPKRNEYALKVQRLRSFDDWPAQHHLSKEDLSDAGFYFAG